jgi:hypothetical protein
VDQAASVGLSYRSKCQFEGRVFGDGRYRFPAMEGVMYAQTLAEALPQLPSGP